MRGNSTPRILLGLVLVFVGVTMLGAPFLSRLERVGMRFWQYLSPIRQKVFPLNTYPRAMAAGLLWGYLPCGLVYGALLIAVVAHNPLGGAALMFVFGLGTIPMLVATHETVGWLRDKIGRLRLRQINGVIMILSGLAVAFVPMIMQNRHSGAQMNHGSPSSMMSNSHSQHNTNDMSHTMTDTADKGSMSHNMTGVDNTDNMSNSLEQHQTAE
jgi:sulfite exporter TauE/SafE